LPRFRFQSYEPKEEHGNESEARAHSAGYFSPDRFSGRVGKFGRHELALNPDGFLNHTDQQICQTLVHEMVHVWQHAHGTPSGRGYHNKE
jgi:predicted SprT family Zn-dependent metalloprotease